MCLVFSFLQCPPAVSNLVQSRDLLDTTLSWVEELAESSQQTTKKSLYRPLNVEDCRLIFVVLC